MDEYKLRTEQMTVGYHGVPLIRDITIRVRKGEILTLIGPNGAGKSTILKSIIRQLALLGGTVYLDGRSMRNISERDIARSMSVLMTERIRPELMTCGDVVATGRHPYTGRMGILSAEDRQKVREAMELVHAHELYDCDFSRISDGQRQRVLLARAICQDPEVIVLDEPTSFLDIRYKLELLSTLKQLVRERQLAVILSLHEIDLAQKVSDYVLCVRGNSVDRFGTPEEIFSGGYITELYGISTGSYSAVFGISELQAVAGPPQVFVIGGGGTGVPVYRRLQRQGRPFAAGILHENDLDYPVAAALASRLISERPYQPIGQAAFQEALAVMERCGHVLCCASAFGPLNEKNRLLAEAAQARGILEDSAWAPRASELQELRETQQCPGPPLHPVHKYPPV